MKHSCLALLALVISACTAPSPTVTATTTFPPAVTVVTYTPTPSKTPSITPTSTATPLSPTSTPTPPPSLPALTSPPPTQPPPAPIPALTGDVVYGVHVLNPANAPLAGELGVSVVKLQVRWAEIGDCNGTNFSGLDSAVSQVANSGLKVLLSIVTAPACSNSAGSIHFPPDDPQLLGNFAASLATRYSNIWGIEVWNEENLDREWGVPDPAKYTEVLQVAYSSIKAANPGVVVIIGALAPTWHNPPAHWDDIVFYQTMGSVGAAQYADCIGIHANSLTFTPSAKSIDGIHSVNGNTHHSWYFYDTAWDSWNAFGGKLPICITEFGVATPGAVGGLSPGFEWANTNTLENQAVWLVEGMKLAQDWGIVKAVIIWNLDFSPECGGCVDEKSPYSILSPSLAPLPAYSAIQLALGH